MNKNSEEDVLATIEDYTKSVGLMLRKWGGIAGRSNTDKLLTAFFSDYLKNFSGQLSTLKIQWYSKSPLVQ